VEPRASRARDRLIGAALFLPCSIVLGLAGYLTPDVSGVGTHQQLGLSECIFLVWTGIPCPMCGMTTTFSHMAHLEPFDALLNQPFGVALFLATLFLAVLGGVELVKPAARWRTAVAWASARDRTLALALLAGLVLGWVYKILLMQGILPWRP
jgi:TRAP-type C4-dicarboxylate transport system permease small subunit